MCKNELGFLTLIIILVGLSERGTGPRVPTPWIPLGPCICLFFIKIIRALCINCAFSNVLNVIPCILENKVFQI